MVTFVVAIIQRDEEDYNTANFISFLVPFSECSALEGVGFLPLLFQSGK